MGRASLMHLLETVTTFVGEATLRAWLLTSASAERVRVRQQAVAELSGMIDLREELAVHGRALVGGRPDPEPFLKWAESEPNLRPRRGILWAARACPVLLWLLLLAQVTGLTDLPLWIAFLAGNIVITVAAGAVAYRTITALWQQEPSFRQYARLLEILAVAPVRSPAMRTLQATLAADGMAAHRLIKRVGRLTALSIPRSAPLYWPIQVLTLWDIHVLAALENWQHAAGPRARGWLHTLGEAEALCALATLAHDNPDWAYPEVDPSAPSISARALGHPLLPDDVRVPNDVQLGPRGSFLLVTGSNMSGKSTLLRAIGVNLVLAGAGAPVCARQFRAPPVELWTSMRVQDSLERGVSYFMAELQRLKAVVDAARQTTARQERVFCYLLDEILQGTNTVERQVAARRIISYLVSLGALGAVSTHDLTLADTPELTACARAIHFVETISTGASGAQMTFDYIARPGLARSTNALRLMQIVGLDFSDVPALTSHPEDSAT